MNPVARSVIFVAGLVLGTVFGLCIASFLACPVRRATTIHFHSSKMGGGHAAAAVKPAGVSDHVRGQPCCVGGLRCAKADPHHLIDGKGDARKGMSQTAPDRYLLFHLGKGVFEHFDEAQRLTFQEQECERLRAIWADLNELGVWQEPMREAV